ncbi:hypothetical protein GM547_14225, partial [Streptococcus pneumoniae]|uniref:hypothetical protein n=1 Tax=Streptococcus pneumoniae TaxID=1313 RepID=UPI0012D7F655
MEDRIEHFKNVTIPDTGLTVTYDESFNATPTLVITVIDLEEGDVVTVTSEDENGFTITVTNASVGVERHFNYHS